jgi:hypothetical protein
MRHLGDRACRLGQRGRGIRPDDRRPSFIKAAESCDKVRATDPADLFDALFDLLQPQSEFGDVDPGPPEPSGHPEPLVVIE